MQGAKVTNHYLAPRVRMPPLLRRLKRGKLSSRRRTYERKSSITHYLALRRTVPKHITLSPGNQSIKSYLIAHCAENIANHARSGHCMRAHRVWLSQLPVESVETSPCINPLINSSNRYHATSLHPSVTTTTTPDDALRAMLTEYFTLHTRSTECYPSPLKISDDPRLISVTWNHEGKYQDPHKAEIIELSTAKRRPDASYVENHQMPRPSFKITNLSHRGRNSSGVSITDYKQLRHHCATKFSSISHTLRDEIEYPRIHKFSSF